MLLPHSFPSELPDTLDVLLARKTLLDLQQRIFTTLEALDGTAFLKNAWSTEAQPNTGLFGEGITGVMEGGKLFERGVVGFSHVHGACLPNAATVERAHLKGSRFEALGVSLVLHPENPYCPTVHMNVRLLIAYPNGTKPENASQYSNQQIDPLHEDSAKPVFWFGGGMDLTPYYGFVEDTKAFHYACQEALTPFGEDWYPRCKQACDAYFFLKHRQEPRGVGGIFYDDVSELGFAGGIQMMQNVGAAFLQVYPEILQRRRTLPFGTRERDFQAYRRGRYVEFNLALDRGTLFGLQSGGRTESILMSLPPTAAWRYDWKPEPDSPEAELYTQYLVPRDWLQASC